MRLTKQGETALKAVEDAMSAYKQALKELETEFKYRKEVLKNPVRTAVLAAEDASIPQRRIHMAAGYSHPSGLANFLNGGYVNALGTNLVPERVLEEALEAAKPRVGDLPVRVEEIQGGVFDYLITDTFGEEFEMGGMGAREGMAIILFAKDVDTHTDGPEIRAAIDNHFDGKVDWH